MPAGDPAFGNFQPHSPRRVPCGAVVEIRAGEIDEIIEPAGRLVRRRPYGVPGAKRKHAHAGGDDARPTFRTRRRHTVGRSAPARPRRSASGSLKSASGRADSVARCKAVHLAVSETWVIECPGLDIRCVIAPAHGPPYWPALAPASHASVTVRVAGGGSAASGAPSWPTLTVHAADERSMHVPAPWLGSHSTARLAWGSPQP